MIKTTSLETSKLLKDNGFPQDKPEKHWVDINFSGARGPLKPYAMPFLHGDKPWDKESLYSKHYLAAAPTTDELLEELPYYVINKNGETGALVMGKPSNIFNVQYRPKGSPVFKDQSLPEALSQCWLYLKREGLLNEKEA